MIYQLSLIYFFVITLIHWISNKTNTFPPFGKHRIFVNVRLWLAGLFSFRTAFEPHRNVVADNFIFHNFMWECPQTSLQVRAHRARLVSPSTFKYTIPPPPTPKAYIGQASRALKTRIKEHAKAMTTMGRNSPLAEHHLFNLHEIDLEEVDIIDSSSKTLPGSMAFSPRCKLY